MNTPIEGTKAVYHAVSYHPGPINKTTMMAAVEWNTHRRVIDRRAKELKATDEVVVRQYIVYVCLDPEEYSESELSGLIKDAEDFVLTSQYEELDDNKALNNLLIYPEQVGATYYPLDNTVSTKERRHIKELLTRLKNHYNTHENDTLMDLVTSIYGMENFAVECESCQEVIIDWDVTPDEWDTK